MTGLVSSLLVAPLVLSGLNPVNAKSNRRNLVKYQTESQIIRELNGTGRHAHGHHIRMHNDEPYYTVSRHMRHSHKRVRHEEPYFTVSRSLHHNHNHLRRLEQKLYDMGYYDGLSRRAKKHIRHIVHLHRNHRHHRHYTHREKKELNLYKMFDKTARHHKRHAKDDIINSRMPKSLRKLMDYQFANKTRMYKMGHRHSMSKANSMSPSSMRMMMNMHGDPAPASLVPDENAKYSVGSNVKILANHMPGMMNAEGTVVGAYRAKLYEVNYKPTNGGAKVYHHKWVIRKEMKKLTHGHITVGSRVRLTADHMKGMNGAKATIVRVHRGPAYMVNYTDSQTGMRVTNHKWLAQSELTNY